MANISENLLNELIKLALKRKEICRIIQEHLKYEYIAEPAYKELIKEIITYFKHHAEDIPTLGYVTQQFSRPKKNENEEKIRREILAILHDVKNMSLPKEDIVLKGLEEYIKDSKFVIGYKKLGKTFTSGDKETARKIFEDYGKDIATFSILKGSQKFTLLFDGFRKRMGNRKALRKALGGDLFQPYINRTPWGIPAIDDILNGGSDPSAGDLDCLLARSGAGKSYYCRWRGVENSRVGHKVLHISLEETKEKVELKYDETWTGTYQSILESGEIQDELVLEEIYIAIDNILEQGGEVAIDAHEEFGKMSVPQVAERIDNYERLYGELPKLVIIDYLELLDPGTGIFYKKDEERFRRLDIAEALRNISNSYKINIFSPTQADSVKKELWNNPAFFMTRDNISECKGLTKPFSNFFTWNVTLDEYEQNMGRAFGDKLRGKKGNFLIELCTSFDTGRFYDHLRTLEL